MKVSSELKKATQECQHAEKMAEKWVDKAKRKRAKVTELENIHKLDFLEKHKIGIDDLERMVALLPSLGAVPVETSERTEVNPQTGDNKEEFSHDKQTNII